ncbi:carboxylate-amine ligase [Amycolatopsis taiwanensis]|uniref:Putative glutamate--cysteine ligase 2 n=1 Tax=Amycolatopsis taiwanensis TaxID=342230 RepID=A0A9W6RAX6_9PSEU|nr:glutamate--cysteine ligase [Amycolatopsis taiwanensis]GLY71400.1 putative glutamate--cysteine ligase 2 [Amycolatopsis taiwanensis]
MSRIAIRHRRHGDSGAGDGTAVPGLTFGVEEEFLLLDPATGATVPRAGRVLSGLSRLPGGGLVQRELRATQIEAATGICRDVAELSDQLVEGRRSLRRAAARHDAVIAACGTPVRSGPAVPGSNEGRFARVDRTYRGMVADYEACGCHVHVGVGDAETAVAVVNHLRPWLPTLLAISVNSPFDRGHDTGYGSWRMVQQSRFPGAGVPPFFSGYAEYSAEVSRLVDCGALVDPWMTFWLARPSMAFPTVEFRVADTACSVDEAVLQALLSRALVHRALTDLDRGREAVRPSDQVAAAALWAAARDGVGGEGVHPALARRMPARRILGELLEHVHPVLTESEGDLVRDLVCRLDRSGTGADRQRRAAATGFPALITMLTGDAERV